MFCPVCKDVSLSMTDRQGIEIDYCPQCRGIWLDRGELDKLIERSEVAGGNAARPAPSPGHARPADEYRDGRRDDKHGRYEDGRYKRKKSILGELFDF